MSFSNFTCGAKGAWLDGSAKTNNKFYHLTPGKVSLQDFSFTRTGDEVSLTISLMRVRSIKDKNYGTKPASKNMEWEIDTDSDKASENK